MDNLRHALRAVFEHTKERTGNVRFYQYRFTKAEIAPELTIGGFEVIKVQPIHKRQGVMRSLHHEFGLPYDWLLTKGLAYLLAPLVTGWMIAHMVLAVARKRV